MLLPTWITHSQTYTLSYRRLYMWPQPWQHFSGALHAGRAHCCAVDSVVLGVAAVGWLLVVDWLRLLQDPMASRIGCLCVSKWAPGKRHRLQGQVESRAQSSCRLDTYGIGSGMGKGKRIFLPPCNKSAAIRAFFIIFFLPASTPVCCWLISANNNAKLINVAKVINLMDLMIVFWFF